MNDCLFCKIIAGEIPSKKVYEDNEIFAFRDINPKAPDHILIVPKRHIDRIENLQTGDAGLMGNLIFAAKKIADDLSLKHGYRIVFNNGPDSGQEVEHIHLHLLAGRKFTWPPG